MAKMNEMRLLRESLGLGQREMGVLMGVEDDNAQSAWQRWESNPEKPSAKKALEKAKEIYRQKTGHAWAPGPLEVRELSAPYIAAPLPGEYTANAWTILHEAARAGGADLMAMDVEAVGEILGSIADAVAAGRGEEARLRLVRRAEVMLKAMGRAAP